MDVHFYDKLKDYIYSKDNFSPIELISLFSHFTNLSDESKFGIFLKVRKRLLNSKIHDIKELEDLKIYFTNTIDKIHMDLNEQINDYNEKITLYQVLNYVKIGLTKRTPFIECRQFFTPDIDGHILNIRLINIEENMDFVFYVTSSELLLFFKICLEQLELVKLRLNSMKKYSDEMNKKYGFYSPKISGSIRSGDESCEISDYYINNDYEEMYILKETGSYPNRVGRSFTYHGVFKKKDLENLCRLESTNNFSNIVRLGQNIYDNEIGHYNRLM